VAHSAEQGLEIARSARPDVVIMDINLPGMSGYEALQQLRARPDTANLPVIALTAAATEDDRKRGQQAGFARYMTKPLDIEAMETALRMLTS
ncbi:MAG TPA: response regulator, partial [Polyangiales bacterium]|nr:response regulator [Polyangiales bacterium]